MMWRFLFGNLIGKNIGNGNFFGSNQIEMWKKL